MELKELTLRLLVFLLLGSGLLLLIDRTFRRRTVLHVRDGTTTYVSMLGSSWRHIFSGSSGAWSTLAETLLVAAALLVFPVFVMLLCITGAIFCMMLYGLAAFRRSSVEFLPIVLLAGLFVLALTASYGGFADSVVVRTAQNTAEAVSSSLYKCAIIEPDELSTLTRDERLRLDLAMQSVRAGLSRHENNFEAAISEFTTLYNSTDEDDDLHFVAKNNLGCLLLAHPPALLAEDGTIFPAPITSLTSLSLMSVASATGDMSQQGNLPEDARPTCAVGDEYLTGIKNSHDEIDKGNSMAAQMASLFGCVPPPGLEIVRAERSGPQLELEWPVAEQKSVKGINVNVAGYYGAWLEAPQTAKDIRYVTGVSGEDVFCYSLDSLARTDTSGPKGEGTIFMDKDKPSWEQDVSLYRIESRNGALRLDDQLNAFVLKIDASGLTEAEGKAIKVEVLLNGRRLQLFQNGQQVENLVLSPSDRKEIVAIALPDGNQAAKLEVSVDGGRLGGTPQWINSLQDEDVFKVDIDPVGKGPTDRGSSVTITREACGRLSTMIGMADAVAELKKYVGGRTSRSAAEAVQFALRLGDPDSPAIATETWADLCKWGSLAGNATLVIDTACKTAVDRAESEHDLHPDDQASRRRLAKAHDSLGIAYLQTRDYGLAKSELGYALFLAPDMPNADLRTRWHQMLSIGILPVPKQLFGDGTIERLAKE